MTEIMTEANPAGMTRQQLYDRIRKTSRDEFVLDEMIRLGFWPSDQAAPSLPEQIIRREGELGRELTELLKKQRRYENREFMLREMRKKRMEDSRQKQAENKKRREEERFQRAGQWQNRKEKEILWLGAGVSGGLNQQESDTRRLQQYGLPFYANAEELASAMGISIGQLRFLAFDRKTAKISHYKRFYIPKKTGGRRLISAPMPRLKNAQSFILQNILSKIPLYPCVHGFVQGKSIVSNAEPHLGRDMVINLDLKDFFPTVTYARVKGLFRSLGYSEAIATVLGLICTEADTDEVILDGISYHVAASRRHLPQGSPASPAISNLVCRKMDRRLRGAADALGFTYTRYADDLSFSASSGDTDKIKKLLWQVRQIVSDEGFALHQQKQRIMRKGNRQEVTGIVVNEKPGINRKSMRSFRALLFQMEKDGPEGKHWNQSRNLMPAVQGYAAYVSMVNPEKGKILRDRIKGIVEKYPIRHVVRHRKKMAEPELPAPKKPWWKFW